MAFYAYEEDDVWKCSQHPSKRRRTGICSICLSDRLASLSPDCASTSSSSPSSSFSLQLPDGRISNLVDVEPSFRRSTSAAVFSIFRSARFSGDDQLPATIPKSSRTSSYSILSVFRMQKSRTDEELIKMQRSKSSYSPAPAKGKGWHFPSPMKVFRHSKAAKVVQEQSPLHRG